MDRFVIAHTLNSLLAEAESIAGGLESRAIPPDRLADVIAAWHAAAYDVLASALPPSSQLLANFERAWRQYTGDAREGSLTPRHIIAEDGTHFSAEGDAKKFFECCRIIIFQARRVILSRPFTADDRDVLRHEVRSAITETYLSYKAWWFYIPSAMLFTSFVFAITGVFKIGNLRVDLDNKVAEARTTIDEQTADASTKVQSLVNKVDTADKKANQAISEAQEKTQALNDHVGELNKKAYEAIDGAKQLAQTTLDSEIKGAVSNLKCNRGS